MKPTIRIVQRACEAAKARRLAAIRVRAGDMGAARGRAEEGRQVVRIYLASSWRNPYQPEVLSYLREMGHTVYDFRNPVPGNNGFSWSQCGAAPMPWTPAEYRYALGSVPARRGFTFDMAALRACDACVLLMPCGRSAHLEAGWAAGAGKRLIVYLPEQLERVDEPELMYLMGGAAGRVLAFGRAELARALRGYTDE